MHLTLAQYHPWITRYDLHVLDPCPTACIHGPTVALLTGQTLQFPFLLGSF